MAKFGQSFNNILMAEAMLEDEYRATHTTVEDLVAEHTTDTRNDTGNNNNNSSSSSSSNNKNNNKNHSSTGSINNAEEDKKRAAPSALKTRNGNSHANLDASSSFDATRSSTSGSSKGDIRSVVIQVPPKRQRMMDGRGGAGNDSTGDIVETLHRAMTDEERWEALQNAMAAFEHNDRDRHNQEITAGADIALVKALVFLEFKSGFRREPIKADMNAITREISMVLTALECVYRASSESIGESFNRVGTDLLHILVILIDDEIKSRVEALSPDISSYSSYNPESANPEGTGSDDDDVDNELDGNQSVEHEDGEPAEERKRPVTPPSPLKFTKVVSTRDRDILLKKATKIIGHYARVGKATKPLAHFPGFLGSTLNLINIRPYPTVPFEARLSCLWTIANLACNTENMTMMMCTPSLLDSLIHTSSRKPEAGDCLETIMEILRAKSIASRALLNLSWSPENKVLLSQNPALVDVLSHLAMERRAPYRKSKTMQDIMTHTRQNAIGAIRNMAAAPRRSKILLCQYQSGKLLDVLTDIALNETDQGAVDLAFAAIHNLAIHDTAEAIVDRPAMVLALKNVLLEDDDGYGYGGGGGGGDGDGTADTNEGEAAKNSRQSHASSTILVLERSITPEMPSYENLRELLDAINPSNPADQDSDLMDDADSVNATAV